MFSNRTVYTLSISHFTKHYWKETLLLIPKDYLWVHPHSRPHSSAILHHRKLPGYCLLLKFKDTWWALMITLQFAKWRSKHNIILNVTEGVSKPALNPVRDAYWLVKWNIRVWRKNCLLWKLQMYAKVSKSYWLTIHYQLFMTITTNGVVTVNKNQRLAMATQA